MKPISFNLDLALCFLKWTLDRLVVSLGHGGRFYNEGVGETQHVGSIRASRPAVPSSILGAPDIYYEARLSQWTSIAPSAKPVVRKVLETCATKKVFV